MITSDQVNQMMMQQMAGHQQMMDMAQSQNMMPPGMQMGPLGPYQSTPYGNQYETAYAASGVSAAAPWAGLRVAV